jgi:iron(III) transport system substrate-binding protein
MPDAVLQRERHGYPFGFHLPPDTPVLTEGVAIVKGARNRAWAEKFYEFVTTPEALAHQAAEYGKVPARDDIDPAMLPAWMNEQAIDAMHIDWAEFARNESEWCNRWQREVYEAK